MIPILLFLAISRIAPDAAAGAFKQPQLAVANGQVMMTFGAQRSIYFASSPDQGKTFNTPVKVAEAATLGLGRHRGPRLTAVDSALVITAVVGDKAAGAHVHGPGEDANLVAWRSTDAGKTWTRIGSINDVPGSAHEGLHAIAAGPGGVMFAVWLDLRAAGTRLYGSRSIDGGRTWSKNVAVYTAPGGTICQCCAPSVQVDADGTIWAMWRNVTDGSRDMFIAKSRDGVKFDAAAKVGDGTWKINACPMDGGGFFVQDGKVTSAWRRESDVYLAESGKAERRLAAGKDVAVAHSGHGTYVAWTRSTGGIEVSSPGERAPVLLAAEGGFVSLIALPDGGVLAAWESGESIELRKLN